MKLGVAIGDFAWEGGPTRTAQTLVEIARSAEETGFDLISVGDHLWQGPHFGGPEQPQLECFTTLSVIAANTQRCRLASLVAGVHFRHPSVLAKALTTLDVLSGGRAMLGLGVGWDEDEARGMGISYAPLAERFAMLEETIQICRRLWDGDERPFTGTHYRLPRPLGLPRPLSRPHPPILIGGGGEKKTLRLVARHADACNLYPGPDLPGKLDVLRRHCVSEGRDFDSIEKTCTFPFDVGDDGEKAGELVAELHRLRDLGMDTVIGIIFGRRPVQQVDIIGKRVLPEIS